MRIMKYCVLCGAAYYTGNGRAKYCSDECRKEAYKRQQAAWKKNHPDYFREYARDHPEVRERFLERHPNYERDRWRAIRETKRQ